MTFAERVTDVLDRQDGMPDRPIAVMLKCRVQQVNSECRHLETLGLLERRKVGDEPIGNYLVRKRPKLTVV